MSTGGAGAAGLVAGHLSGVVGCDFTTGRTGNGAILVTGATTGVVDVAALVEVVGAAGCWVVWQPQASAHSSRALVSRAVVAESIDFNQSRSSAGCRPTGGHKREP
jgi:hypothetical protein